MTALMWHPVSGVLTRRGRPDPRLGLVYGDYLPEAAATFGTTGFTAGLSNAGALTDYNASSVNSFTCTNGQTFTDKTVHGDIRFPTAHTTDIVFENCRLRGGPQIPTGIDAVVKADNNRSGTGRVILVDCEVDPQLPALNRDGIRGNRVEVYRSWIHDVIDGFVPYATTTNNSGNAYAYMYGCVVERLRYHYPDWQNGVSGATWHTDGTHNDCVAISGGKNMTIKGNYLRASSVDLPGTGTNPTHPQLQATGHAMGAGTIITNTVSNPLNTTVVVEQNWFWGGLANVNVKANMTMLCRNNWHFREAPTISTNAKFWWRYDLRAGNGVVADNSRWWDGPYQNAVLIEPRDLGVHFNA